MEPSDATTIAEAVRTGRRRAVEVVTEALDRATETHDELNAFTLIDRSGALAHAEDIDRLVESGRDPGPLAGVPVALKDLIDQAGLPNTKGSGFPSTVPEHSATVVRRLGSAGAVVIGRTGLHEWAFGFTSENAFFGPVRNPLDPTTSPGGSSGGSGAAVAAGITPVAIGTDTGGSVRNPAALCGVFGLKPTHGCVPLTGVYPLAPSLDTVGPIARTVSDLAVTHRAIAGYDPKDRWSTPDPATPVDPRMPRRIGIVTQWMEAGPSSSAVRAGMRTFADRASAAGWDVVELDEPRLAVPDAVFIAAGPEILTIHRQRLAEHPDRYSDETRERLAQCATVTIDDVVTAAAWSAAARNRIAGLGIEGIPILAAPTVGAMRKRIGAPDVDIDGRLVFHRSAFAMFTAPINRIGVPALAAPIPGTGAVPVSVQLVTDRLGDEVLLSVASDLEAAGVIGVADRGSGIGT